MIHYVTQVEENGDETVLLTFDDELDALKYAMACYTRDADYGKYRVDSTEPTKEFLSATYGKVMHRKHIKMPVNFADYADSLPVQPQRADFTLEELLPTAHDVVVFGMACRECACEVRTIRSQLKGHVTWHNKLLP